MTLFRAYVRMLGLFVFICCASLLVPKFVDKLPTDPRYRGLVVAVVILLFPFAMIVADCVSSKYAKSLAK